MFWCKPLLQQEFVEHCRNVILETFQPDLHRTSSILIKRFKKVRKQTICTEGAIWNFMIYSRRFLNVVGMRFLKRYSLTFSEHVQYLLNALILFRSQLLLQQMFFERCKNIIFKHYNPNLLNSSLKILLDIKL